MITLDEFKKLATVTGLLLWKNEVLFYESEETWYISYPLPMFKENCEEPDDYKLKSSIISFAPYKEKPEIYIYDEVIYDYDHLDKIVGGKEIWCYNLVSSIQYDDGQKWNDKTYEEILEIILQTKKKIFEKQQEINLEKIKGDF